MTTIAFKPGSTGPLTFQPEQPDGTTPDLTGVGMQLRIFDGATCITLPGVLDDDLFEVDVSGLTLRPRLYPASVYFNWGDGWVREGMLNIEIQGGC